MERNKFVDILKGYACLLVVFGHVLSGVRSAGISDLSVNAEKFIWSFHVDLFMFLSGFVFTLTGTWHKRGSRLRFIGGKLLSLGVPYVIFSSLYIAVNSLVPGVNNVSVLSDILFIFVKPVAQYWFIYALLWLFILFCILPDIIPPIAKTLILYSIFIFCKCLKIDMGFLDYSLNCVLVFGLGASIKSFKELPMWVKIIVPIFHIAVSAVLIKFDFINLLFVDDLLSLLGIFASICFISLLSRLSPVSRFLDFIASNSFQIYLLHTFFTAGIRIVLIKLGITNFVLHIILGTVFGIVFPCLIAKIASLTPYLNIFFFPEKAIKQLKKSGA